MACLRQQVGCQSSEPGSISPGSMGLPWGTTPPLEVWGSASHWRQDHMRPWHGRETTSLRREMTSLVPESHKISICSPGTSGLRTRRAVPVIRVSRPCCVTFLCQASVTTAQTWPHEPEGEAAGRSVGMRTPHPEPCAMINKNACIFTQWQQDEAWSGY